MVKISLSPRFLADSFYVLKRKGLGGLLFGTKAAISEAHKLLLGDLESNAEKINRLGGRSGSFVSIDAIHRGKGKVYLLPDPTHRQKTLLLFDSKTKIANAPDLWAYLSTSADPHNNLGEITNFGLMSGNKGQQGYSLDISYGELRHFKTAVIYCKQFEVVMCYAKLA